MKKVISRGVGMVGAALFCCLVGCAIFTNSGETMTLVKDGKPEAVIVVSEKPTLSAQFAAKELQDQIKQISGATLPISTSPEADKIAVYVGESKTVKDAGLGNDQFKEQEYVIEFQPNSIILTGLDAPNYGKLGYDPANPDKWRNLPGFWDERGTLNAVYDFMERYCGVRYFNPTEFGTSYPKKTTLTISGKNIRRKPFFRYRDVHPVTNQPHRMDSVNILWTASKPEFKEWRALAYPELTKQFPDKKQFNRAYNNIARRYLLRSRNGGEKIQTNHSLYPYYNYFWDKKSKNFLEDKPKWFAQGQGDGRPEQMCYTNEELIEQVAKEGDNYFQGKNITGKGKRGPNWGRTNFAVVPQDNEFHCRCPKCQKLLRKKTGEPRQHDYSTDLMFNFVHKVAEKINKTHPDKTVSSLAYSGYMTVPNINLSDNLAVHFCWEHNRSPEFSEGYKKQEKYLREWAVKNPPKGLYLWLYYTFPWESAYNGNYHCFPGFFAHTIGKQFKLFHKLNLKGMFHCGYGQEVESYVTFRLMDDPTLDVDELLDEYFQRMYGPAAKPMQEIYNTIERIYQDPKNHPTGKRGAEVAWGYQGTPERMKKLQALLDKAKKLATASPYKEQVELWNKGVWRYMTKGAKMYQEKMSAPMPSVSVPKVASAGGDFKKVDWKKAVVMNNWFNFGLDTPATRKLSVKLAHDKKYLYMELDDPCDTTKLNVAAQVFPADDWEIFISRQRGMPYRQYAVGPTGKLVSLAHGEINFRRNVKLDNPGLIIKSEKKAGLWRTRIAMPLDKMLARPVKPGETLYMNIMRIASQAVSKAPGRFDMSSLVSHAIVHDPIRFADITLEK